MGLAGIALDYPDFGQGERRVAFLGGTGFQACPDFKFIILQSKIKNFISARCGVSSRVAPHFFICLFLMKMIIKSFFFGRKRFCNQSS